MTDYPFLNAISYKFNNIDLLRKALIHPSVSSLYRETEFERLEFLGDRVLGLVIAHSVYSRHPEEPEGDLAKRFASLVCREACMDIAIQINLDRYLKVSAGDATPNSAILADGVEALIGAIYLDGGMESATRFITCYWAALWEKDRTPPKDAKTTLQEYAQKKGSGIVPVYKVTDHTGPAHAPTFCVQVSVKGLGDATGCGASKRQAEQAAAKTLLETVKA
jgi:ribonuclease-3